MSKNKLTLTSLILMIFTSVFGFTNISKAFYLMGYSSIFWYIIAALTFFLPFAFMLAEFGAAFKDSKGGIYSWMAESFSPKFAFIGTFMWYASNIFWLVNVASSIWVPLSNFIFGIDKTQQWHLFSLNSVQTLGVLAIFWIMFITIIGSKGLDKIKKITSVGGLAVAGLNILLLVGGFLILILNGGITAEPLTASAFFHSPNESYTSMISIFSFSVFALFAYGGIEVMGGLVDETENAAVTFPKGVTISAIIIAIGYAVGIFVSGAFTNWQFTFTEFSAADVTLGNVAFISMNNMGYQLGHALNLSETMSISLGNWVSRYTGISMFLAFTGGCFTMIYSPLKQFIEGTPTAIWPKKITQLKNNMPVNAMIAQAGIIIIIIGLVSFGGDSATAFFNILTAMTNVAITLPYIFLSIAFIGFKEKESIIKPFEIYHSKRIAKFASYMVTLSIGVANLFTIIEPAVHGNIGESIWTALGPIIFGILAWLLFTNYEKKQLQGLKE